MYLFLYCGRARGYLCAYDGFNVLKQLALQLSPRVYSPGLFKLDYIHIGPIQTSNQLSSNSFRMTRRFVVTRICICSARIYNMKCSREKKKWLLYSKNSPLSYIPLLLFLLILISFDVSSSGADRFEKHEIQRVSRLHYNEYRDPERAIVFSPGRGDGPNKGTAK